MKTFLALDLEGTIIPHWNQMDTYINMDKLDSIIEKYKPEAMTIYSYAVWSLENHQHLRKSKLIKDLTVKNGNNFVDIYTTHQMVDDWYSLHQHKHLNVNETTIWQMPKEFAFLMMVRDMSELSIDFDRFILFDDTVPHEMCYTLGNGVQVIFLNPDNM